MVRETTCICEKCFIEKDFVCTNRGTCGWKKHSLTRTKTTERILASPGKSVPSENDSNEVKKSKECIDSTEPRYKQPEYVVGDFVAA